MHIGKHNYLKHKKGLLLRLEKKKSSKNKIKTRIWERIKLVLMNETSLSVRFV